MRWWHSLRSILPPETGAHGNAVCIFTERTSFIYHLARKTKLAS
jgi:hypothetical protein